MSTDLIKERIRKPDPDAPVKSMLQAQQTNSTLTDAPDEQRSIDVITTELLSYKDRFGEAAYMIGKLLLEAKGQLKKNELWLDWLQHRAAIPERTAQRFMRLAKGYSNPTALSDLGMTKALALLTLPEDERDAFMKDTHEVNGVKKSLGEMSCREVEKVIQDHRNRDNEKTSSGNEPEEQSEPSDTSESEDSDPVAVLIGGIAHVERTLNIVLETFCKETDDPKEYHELNNRLRKILNETLQKLPPTVPTVEDQPA